MTKRTFHICILKGILLLVLLIDCQNILFAQQTIKGPTCVKAGIAYRYEIVSNNAPDRKGFRVCITGGVFDDGDSCKIEMQSKTEFVVVWKKDRVIRFISVITSQGPVQYPVQEPLPLSGGKINKSDGLIFYDSTQKEFTIGCSSPSGGTCKPSYKYQWQVAKGNQSWTDIPGATSEKLRFVPTNAPMRIRRKTVDEMSSTLAYSDIAIVVLRPYSKDKRAKKQQRSL